MLKFQKLLFRHNNVLNKAKNHPFNQKLYDGSLSKKIFAYYLHQDKIYLKELANTLKILAVRFSSNEMSKQFYHIAVEIIDSEAAFHQQYCENQFFQLANANQSMCWLIKDYSQHLIFNAKNSSLEVAIASVVPCFWIYHELGKFMNIQACAKNHPYMSWIESYSNDTFKNYTQFMLNICSELFEKVADKFHQDQITDAFIKSVTFELNFFDHVYKKTPASFLIEQVNANKLEKANNSHDFSYAGQS